LIPWTKIKQSIFRNYRAIAFGNLPALHKKTAGVSPAVPRGGGSTLVYCAALRGTDRGSLAEFTFDKASNMGWYGGRLM